LQKGMAVLKFICFYLQSTYYILTFTVWCIPLFRLFPILSGLFPLKKSYLSQHLGG
jgi:hypothetical protein